MGNFCWKINWVDGQKWMNIKVGGVPVEAMELFPEGGHIIDIPHNLSEEKRLLAFASIVAIHSFYGLNE
ncbi:hypothetical protein AJ85_00350 [Alkalihalobacillus alcalophilus ATCC 27647 = CGMCC 1.3604]|uniref:Uncharacterized protein n=2 Tax=Alkalihalobacillus alcalophilus TaxID=1445 RepID=A0A094XDE2_ALKAL|nr:hypothetical protein BALCAV_0214300 [Alkalihalobacillus alcalophilus ATCC 27647 = CGMCC 1.3604]THG88725.1 hypothetical protein AJ85_00350 [Alkalihalobacillus alcalophilus ATCC 27647 = CGMCC 1.3604]